jgi:multiple sugar transport system ATP-binding protein
VVLRGGIVQQVGSPTDLYEHPTNLFVAGFIGSPAMNFLPATIEGGSLNCGLGKISMPDRIRRATERAKGREVIIGIRPEHFEDAALVGDVPGATVTVAIDLVESMGSDVYAYFTVRGEAHSSDLDDLAKDAGQDMHGTGTQINARLDAAANVHAGQQAKLWVNTEKTAESAAAHAQV